MKRLDYPAVILLFFYLACAFLLKPWSLDFPLNDDWVYTWAVQHLLEKGSIRLSEWGASTQVVQILWGALWTKILGWSLGSLKISTLVSAIGGAYFLNSILKLLDIPSYLRLLTVLLLAANPIYFCLSFTFMTDVPFLALMLLSSFLFMKAEGAAASLTLHRPWSSAERENSDLWILAGSAAAAAAYLIRQIGAVIPLGYFFFLLLQKRINFKKTLFLWGIPVLAILGYQTWFRFIHGPTWASSNILLQATLHPLSEPDVAVGNILFRLIGSSFLLGFFLSPFAIGFLSAPQQFTRKKSPVQTPPITYFLTVGYFLACSVFLVQQGWMPHLENTLHVSGLGVLTVAGASAKAAGLFDWKNLWTIATLLALTTGLVGLAALGSVWISAKPLEKASLYIFILPASAQIAISIIRDRFFDRYALVLLPPALLIFCLCATRWRLAKIPAYIEMILLLLLSVGGTWDYLAWNQAKWQIKEIAPQQGISPEQIANGFDWDGPWTFERNMEILKKRKPITKIGEWEWQSLNQYKAMTSFQHQIPNHKLLGQVPYHTPLSSKTEYIYLWKLP